MTQLWHMADGSLLEVLEVRASKKKTTFCGASSSLRPAKLSGFCREIVLKVTRETPQGDSCKGVITETLWG